ncbi:MAG: peptidase S8 [Chloroflexi bacterium]|nr:peptidase S8 [Chloroflexota bacterium]
MTLIFLMITPGLAQSPPPQPPLPAAIPPFVPGEIVVKFQPNVGKLGAQNSLRAQGLRPLQVSTDEVLRVQVTPGQEAKVIAELLARGDVAYATYNYQIEALGDPNDPNYNSQWGLNQVSDHDIDAPEAWDIFTGDSNLIIAILDTGVDLDHPDLVAKITSGGQAGYNFVSPGSPPDDDQGHGTHVAGIAAASTNNSVGIAGVSWGARLMPLKVLNSGGGGSTYNLSLAIKYAADHGARVINMSLGGGCGTGWPDVEEAVNYALGQGVVLMGAAGNNGSTPVMCPAAINGVIAVGATDFSDNRPSFSTYGSALAVAAPGSSIYSTYPGGGYTYLSGTSMSTPFVSGLAALLWSMAPSLSNSQVRSLIENTADDLGATGWDQFFGYGRINARRALETMALQADPTQPLLFIDDNASPVSGSVQVITANPDNITWSATISPTVSWLDISPPTSGLVSAASAGQSVTLSATRPVTYGLYTANLVLTGTLISTGGQIGPTVTQVRLQYVPQIYTFRFPVISKN